MKQAVLGERSTREKRPCVKQVFLVFPLEENFNENVEEKEEERSSSKGEPEKEEKEEQEEEEESSNSEEEEDEIDDDEPDPWKPLRRERYPRNLPGRSATVSG